MEGSGETRCAREEMSLLAQQGEQALPSGDPSVSIRGCSLGVGTSLSHPVSAGQAAQSYEAASSVTASILSLVETSNHRQKLGGILWNKESMLWNTAG